MALYNQHTMEEHMDILPFTPTQALTCHCDCWDAGAACCHCGETGSNGSCPLRPKQEKPCKRDTLSFGALAQTACEFPNGTVADTLRASRAAAQQPAAPRPTIEIWNPIDGEQASHTLCDEQVDFLNLTLTRERIELLQERRQWVISRRMRVSINRVCTSEELGSWGGIEKFAYDYAFWYRREEQRMGKRK